MDEGEPQRSRRRVLWITASGSMLPVAGCIGEDVTGVAGERSDRPDDWCFEQLDESVPEVEANAASIDGIERKPEEELLSKEEAAYQCGPSEGQHCGNCTFYIDDRDGDAIGACTEVAGQIRSADWCGIWSPREKIQEQGDGKDD